MSTRRTQPGGWAGRTPARGLHGRGICRRCRAEVPKGRRTFCGPECVDAWRLRTDPGYLREQVYARDRGICARCALDTEAFFRHFRMLPPGRRLRLRRRLDIPEHRENFWDADHVVPVVEGGGECSLSNLRTLCLWCHADETARLRRRLSARSAAVLQTENRSGKIESKNISKREGSSARRSRLSPRPDP